MIRRHRLLVLSLVALAILMGLSVTFADRQIVINVSDSMPHGFYVKTNAVPTVGATVDLVIPASAREYIQARTGHAGNDWYLLKTIAAGPGDTVDATGDTLMINGKARGPIAAYDGAGRTLPAWRECRRLGADEFFVFSDRVPNSFDSRYFGPVTRDQIAAVRRPLVTW